MNFQGKGKMTRASKECEATCIRNKCGTLQTSELHSRVQNHYTARVIHIMELKDLWKGKRGFDSLQNENEGNEKGKALVLDDVHSRYTDRTTCPNQLEFGHYNQIQGRAHIALCTCLYNPD